MGVRLVYGRGEEGACLGLDHPRSCHGSGKEVEEVERPVRCVTAAQELEELLLVPVVLVLEAEVCQPVAWAMVVEVVHVHVLGCAQLLKVSC